MAQCFSASNPIAVERRGKREKKRKEKGATIGDFLSNIHLAERGKVRRKKKRSNKDGGGGGGVGDRR